MYYFVYGLLYTISLLPYFILYGIADIIFLFVYYIMEYRKVVVFANLKNAFPEKKDREIKSIARKFYRNFLESWVDTIKLFSISKKRLNKRSSGNLEIFYKLFKENKAVHVHLGHFFNWEVMSLYTSINQPFPYLAVYLPQSNKMMNRLINQLRTRWGSHLVPSKEISRGIYPWRKKQHLLALVADQNPPVPSNAYWLNFLNSPTSFLKGPEKLPRIQNIPVVMMTTTRLRRGHYHFDYFLITDDPKGLPEGELIRRYVKQIEDNIRLQPEIYLWSHRRWKHKWKPEYKNQWVDKSPLPETEK